MGWASIQTRAAWQAWKYSSSVDSAGTSTLVVTPAGEMPMAPGGNGPGAPDGRADDAAVGLAALPLWPPDEHPATANKPAATTTRTKTPPTGFGAQQQRTISIYATLTGVMERTGFSECCRP